MNSLQIQAVLLSVPGSPEIGCKVGQLANRLPEQNHVAADRKKAISPLGVTRHVVDTMRGNPKRNTMRLRPLTNIVQNSLHFRMFNLPDITQIRSKIARTYEQCIHAVNRPDLLQPLDCGGRFNLNDNAN